MLIVQKSGGSSVANLERIRNVAQRVLATQRAGQDVVVVVSAMAGETNRLIGLANHLANEGDGQVGGASKGPYVASERAGDRAHERELDQLVSTGENVSAALLAMAIQNAGGRAISLVGHQIGLQTDATYTNARILGFSHGRIRQEVTAGNVVVCAGFQGLNAAGNIITLGRGGSDTSAVALAAALKADVLRDLDRRRRRLHHRPADRAARAQDPAHHVRRDARAGEPRRQGAADPQRRVRHEVRRAGARAIEPERERRDVDRV